MNAAVAEALADPRLLVSEADAAAEAARWDDPGGDDLEQLREGRAIEWAARTVTQGEILGAFAAHCRDELDDVEVLEQTPARLALKWRREISSVEIRAGLLFCDRLAAEAPVMLLSPIGPKAVERFVDDATLRSHVAVLDLARLEKIAAVRSSVFVYLEWFLRDEYGVKILPEAGFTSGLVGKGIISLGMG